MNPDIQDQIGKLLDDTLDTSSREELIAVIRSDRALLQEIGGHLEISEALSRLQGGRADETFVHNLSNHILAVGDEGESVFVSQITGRIQKRRASRILAIAATIAVMGGAVFLIHRSQLSTPSVALMTGLNMRGEIITENRIGTGFKHEAPGGLFLLNFNNGTVVAIEGPASFEIVSENAMRLSSGKLNAWCPEAAHGFRVITATGTVTDLGTAFAVSTNGSGGSDVLVLDGLIEVSQGRQSVRLDEGKAVRTSGSAGIKDVEFHPAQFNRTWPLASGILSTRGSVTTAPPGTAEQLSRLENDHSVLVIPERRDVPFIQTIEAELVEPGTFSARNSSQLTTLPTKPGSFLRSYLVRYNPLENKNFRRFEGEVTFDRPVIAICCQGKYLQATDPVFATGNWTSGDLEKVSFRGIDLDQPKEYPDEVRLSDDRRTVHVIFNAGVSTDDIRVIVAEESPEVRP